MSATGRFLYTGASCATNAMASSATGDPGGWPPSTVTVARELPSDEVLASWQHVEQRALDLRAAGMPGTLQELRVTAYLDLLQERDTAVPIARR